MKRILTFVTLVALAVPAAASAEPVAAPGAATTVREYAGYRSSRERTAALDGWLWHYNHRRRHQAIGRQAPITRLNNLLGTYS
jgi:transposase InsO family protein